MKSRLPQRVALSGCVAALWLTAAGDVRANDTPITQEQLQQLQKQNELLQQQLKQQQELIDTLNRKVTDIQDNYAKHNGETSGADTTSAGDSGFRLGKVIISGEGGIAFFDSQANGPTPNNEFRIDEARLFVEAPIWKEVYFFSELDIAQREFNDLNVRGGQVYLDFENVSKLWGRDRQLNVRAGKFYIPFGEEYQNRYAIDNPLISHSVSDLWGADEGVEVYGNLAGVQYVMAVQNGGTPTSQDFTSDKSIAGRIGYDPTRWLHLSVSGMRTGDLSVSGDMLSETWFGSGWFRSIGSSNTTLFHANLFEGDAQVHLPYVQLKAAGGYIDYGDNDPTANNHRDIYYFYAEGVHDFTRELYGAVRFSEIHAHDGYPIVGGGTMGQNFFSSELTSQYWRLSLGLGYRFSRNLVIKGEYTWNQGRETDGDQRRNENLFALEAAFRF